MESHLYVTFRRSHWWDRNYSTHPSPRPGAQTQFLKNICHPEDWELGQLKIQYNKEKLLICFVALSLLRANVDSCFSDFSSEFWLLWNSSWATTFLLCAHLLGELEGLNLWVCFLSHRRKELVRMLSRSSSPSLQFCRVGFQVDS